MRVGIRGQPPDARLVLPCVAEIVIWTNEHLVPRAAIGRSHLIRVGTIPEPAQLVEQHFRLRLCAKGTDENVEARRARLRRRRLGALRG